MTFINLISDGSSSMVEPGTVYSNWITGYVGESARHISASHNQATGGAELATLVGRLSTVSSNLQGGGWNGILCQIGASDMIPTTLFDNFGNSVATWNAAVISSYLIPLAAILRPIYCTTLQPKIYTDPHGDYNVNRNLANPLIRGWLTAGYIDGIVDMAANAVMGPDAAASDPLLYDETGHPTPHGVDLDIAIIKAALDPLITVDAKWNGRRF